MTKLSIVVASHRLDKLLEAAILASTCAALNWEGELFFTFWGLFALRKGLEPEGVSSDYSQYEKPLLDAIRSERLPKWRELIVKAVETGRVRVYACSTTLETFGIKKDDLEEFVEDIVGAATFLSKAKDSNVSLFIS